MRLEDPEWGPGILGWYWEALGAKLADFVDGSVDPERWAWGTYR